MEAVKMLVDDLLLKDLSVETKKIGAKVSVKAGVTGKEFMAEIVDVIILPRADFYRQKFMHFCKSYNHNSVKALKELGTNFPFSVDFDLGIGYVLNVSGQASNYVLLRDEFEVLLNNRSL